MVESVDLGQPVVEKHKKKVNLEERNESDMKRTIDRIHKYTPAWYNKD